MTVDQQPVSLLPEGAMRAQQRLRRRPLQKRPSLRVQRRAHEVVVGGVTDIELDRRIKFDQLHQLRPAKFTALVRRLGLQRLFPQLFDWMQWRDAKGLGGRLGKRQLRCDEESRDQECVAIQSEFHK